MIAECPRDTDFVDILEGRAPAGPDLHAHLAACPSCRTLVEELRAGEDALTDMLAAALRAAAKAPASSVAPRFPIIGRYRVLSLIGRGGMGEVHAAYDPELDRKVALKLLRTSRSPADARERLLREARALGRLSHPNVVQVHDVGEHEGDVFVAMELVEGQALDAWCRSVPAPGWRAVLAAYLDAARGLSAAHDKGLVHRDVKPANLLRGADGRVRVADFGLAAASEAPLEAAREDPSAGASAERLTATGSIVGTPLYMAPEQHEGLRSTPASDQFSLCTALYEALYGVLPLGDGGAALGEILARRRAAMPLARPPGSPVPAWVHAALERGLSTRPEDRYPSMLALVAALGADPERAAAPEVGRVPRPLTPLVGRAAELGEITDRVRATRLLTLTGAGGIGKSRLAVQVALDLAADFAGGAWFVELAPLGDPGLVVPTVASVLGVHEGPGRPILDALVAVLRGRRAFLVLDNCEHVIDAASRLADHLLGACPDLRILATSRQSLGLLGEVAWRVPSLVVDEAVALFQDRAGQKDDPGTVAQICQRLDGIPLAIELAAARTRALSVAQIAARLDDRFRLLTGGSRAALPRHRTLKAAVDWGYQLLCEEEQALLRRLSVFAGGCTLEAAEAVAGADALDDLANLVDKSLIVFSGGRYRLLETVRQYAAERLAERGETDAARARHLDYFVALAEAAEPYIFGGDGHRGWIDRLAEENDNLRAAFELCQSGPPDARRAEAALRLAAGVAWFWFARGHLREGREAITAALARGAEAPARHRARALIAAACLAMWVGDFTGMLSLSAEGAALARPLGDAAVTAYALTIQGAAAVNAGDASAGVRLLAEAVPLARAQPRMVQLCFTLYWAGVAQKAHGDLVAARAALDEGLALARRSEHRPGVGHMLFRIGEVAEAAGDAVLARRSYLESVSVFAEAQDPWGMVQVLDALGRVAVVAGQADRGARLLGAVEALCALTGAQVLAGEEQRRAVADARRALGEEAFAAAWAEGRGLRLDQVILLAHRE